MKKIVMMIILEIILGSCGELRYGIQKTINEAELERQAKILREKEAGGSGEKDEKIVEEAIKNISTRSINKRVQFGETTLLIPENTRINPKVGNIVDEKTGYGIPITFSKNIHCIKKIEKNLTYGFFYDKNNILVSRIAQKIIKANGFKNTCN